MQVQKKHFRSWLGGFEMAEGGFDRTSRTPPGYGHDIYLYSTKRLNSWQKKEQSVSKLNKLNNYVHQTTHL